MINELAKNGFVQGLSNNDTYPSPNLCKLVVLMLYIKQ